MTSFARDAEYYEATIIEAARYFENFNKTCTDKDIHEQCEVLIDLLQTAGSFVAREAIMSKRSLNDTDMRRMLKTLTTTRDALNNIIRIDETYATNDDFQRGLSTINALIRDMEQAT